MANLKRVFVKRIVVGKRQRPFGTLSVSAVCNGVQTVDQVSGGQADLPVELCPKREPAGSLPDDEDAAE